MANAVNFACHNGIEYDSKCLACWKFNNESIPKKLENKFGIEQLKRQVDPNNQCCYYYFTLKINEVNLGTIGNYSCYIQDHRLEGETKIGKVVTTNLTAKSRYYISSMDRKLQ